MSDGKFKKTAKTVKKQDSIKLVIETKMEKEEIGKPGKSENPAVPELGNPGNLEKSGEPELEKPEILTKTVSQPCLHKDIPKIDILEVGEKPECGKTENLSKTENFTEEIGEKKSASSPAIKAKSERKPQIKKKLVVTYSHGGVLKKEEKTRKGGHGLTESGETESSNSEKKSRGKHRKTSVKKASSFEVKPEHKKRSKSINLEKNLGNIRQ